MGVGHGDNNDCMRRKLVLTVVAVVGLIVGLLIGLASHTKTITNTRTVTVAKTRTLVRTRSTVPKGCTEAIADARRVARDAGAGFGVVSNWPVLASEAAVAGAAQDAAKIYSIAATLKTGTARLSALSSSVAADGLAFDAAAARCR